MASIRVTGVQMRATESVPENLEKMLGYVERSESDVILFPLRSLTGPARHVEESSTRRAWDLIAASARKHYTTVIFNTIAQDEDEKYIQTRIYSDQGELVGTQEKLVPTVSDRDWCTPGDELRLFGHNGASFGCLCGNDLWVAPGLGNYPDRRLTCQLGERGARILFHSADSGTDPRFREYFESNLKLRAWESKCYIFTANAAPDSGNLNAPTGVISPEGKILEECPRTGEHAYSFDLDLEEVAE